MSSLQHKASGIDFGYKCSYYCISSNDDIQEDDSNKIDTSFYSYLNNSNMYKKFAEKLKQPENMYLIVELFHLLNRSYSDSQSQECIRNSIYSFQQGDNNKLTIQYKQQDKNTSFHSFISIVKRFLKDIKEIPKEPTNQVVLAVPVFLDDIQCKCLVDTVKSVKYNCSSLIKRPIAAVYGYCENNHFNKDYVVTFDFGSCLEISIVDVRTDDYKIINSTR